jgi:hypothetical protein
MYTINKNVIIVFIITALILMIPVIGMQVSDGWNWTAFDFVFATVLLVGTGLGIEFISRRSTAKPYKYGVILAFLGVFFLVWINGAVGIIGSENNDVNMLYPLVPLVGIFGAIISRLRAKGLSYTLMVMAVMVALIPLVGYTFLNPDISEMGLFRDVIKVIMINTFFVLVFVGSGMLFKEADRSIMQTS